MSSARRHVLRLILCGAAYVVSGLFGLYLSSIDNSVTLIWAPAGIGLGAVIVWGRGMLLAILLSQLIIGFATAAPPGFTLAAAMAAMAEALLAASILRGMGFRLLERGADVIRLLIAAAFASVLGAGIGTMGLVAAQMIAPDGVHAALTHWWLGDFTSILVVTPVFLALTSPSISGKLRSAGAARPVEAAGLILVLALASSLVFSEVFPTGTFEIATSFLLIPLVVLTAYRFGVGGAIFSSSLLAVAAVSGVVNGVGPFALESLDTGLFLTCVFIGVTTVTGIALGTAVESRDQSEASLRESLDWLEMIQTSTGVGTWSWDPLRDTGRVSAPMARLLQIGDSATQVRSGLVSRVHVDDQKNIVHALRQLRDSKLPMRQDFRAVSDDGSVRWYTLRGTSVPVDSDRPDGLHRVVGVTYDVTEERNFDEALRRNERLASLGTFVAGLAHDINNPLGGILLAAETAREEIEDRGVVGQALEDIIEDSQRAARIVRSVMRFAKTDPPERRPCDLNGCARKAIDLSIAYATERGAAIEANLADEQLITLCSQTEIEQLLVNLIRNAAEACESRGEIRVVTWREGNSMRIDVRDDGRGMAEADVLHAFDPFYTTRAVEGGSGLGLSICHGIVTSHGGQIRIKSQAGIETTIEVELPTASENAHQEPDPW